MQRAAWPADDAAGCFTSLGASTCPENLPVAPPPPNARAGGVATLWCNTVKFGQIKRVKMLRVVFHSGFACSCRLNLASSLVDLVANAIPNKVCFKSTLHLHTLKSYACLLTTDMRREGAKSIREPSSGGFHGI